MNGERDTEGASYETRNEQPSITVILAREAKGLLTPIDSQVRTLAPIVYDLEWWPETLILRMVGVKDERGYRHYTSVDAFLDAELSQENRGRTFFAHAGGAFDVQEVLERIHKRPQYHVTASFSGASAVVVTVRKDKHKWTFSDSYFLLPDSLRAIGKTIGELKGDCAFDAPFAELRDYNEQDCTVLLKGIDYLQEGLLALGGELRPTLAACAMRLFRRRYLKRVIHTNERMNDILRDSYCSSRVEVFARRIEKAEYYDVNSSFPFSMTKPQPGNLRRVGMRLPTRADSVWFAEADVTVPEWLDVPPLPYRIGGRIFFPVGSWRGWFTQSDLELLEETGGTVEKIFRVYEFEPFDDLADYVTDIYARKLKAETERDKFGRYLNKRLLVSLYGKFGERTTKESVLIHPERTTCNHNGAHPDDSCIEIVAPGIYKVTEEKKVAHAHVPISSYTTSLSRTLLYRHLVAAKKLAYCDTDSVICGAGEKLPTGHNLGDLKHERTIERAEFLGSKMYAYTSDHEECDGTGRADDGDACKPCKGTGRYRSVRSKGFRKLDEIQFERLRAYEPVEIKRMRGIREGLNRDGEFGRAWSVITKKKLNKSTMPKRAVLGMGTRPWSVDELTERL